MSAPPPPELVIAKADDEKTGAGTGLLESKTGSPEGSSDHLRTTIRESSPNKRVASVRRDVSSSRRPRFQRSATEVLGSSKAKVPLKRLEERLLAKKDFLQAKADCRWYFVFLFVFLFIVYRQRPILQMNSMTLAIRDSLFEEEFTADQVLNHKKTYLQIGAIDEFWQWTKVLGNQLRQSETELPFRSQPILYDNNVVLGSVRFRQVRVNSLASNLCGGAIHNITEFCYPDMTEWAYEQPQNKELDDERKWNDSSICDSTSTSSDIVAQAFCFTPEEVAGEISGRAGAEYPGNGYIVDIPVDENFKNITAQLEEALWIDRGTRGIFITINFFNPNINVFNEVTAIVEKFAGGSIQPWWRFRSMKRLWVYESFDISNPENLLDGIRVVFEALFALLLGYYIYSEAAQAVSMGRRYLKDWWNWLDIINIVLFLGNIWGYFWFWTSFNEAFFANGGQGKALNISPDQFLNIDSPADRYAVAFQLLGINVWISFLKSFKYLKFVKKLHLMWDTIGRAADDLFWFTIFFGIIVMSYAAAGHLVYGPHLLRWRALDISASSVAFMLLGDIDYEEMRVVNRFITPLFVGSFVVAVVFILVNIFIAIISEAFEKQKRQTEERKPPTISGLLRDFGKATTKVYNSLVYRLSFGKFGTKPRTVHNHIDVLQKIKSHKGLGEDEDELLTLEDIKAVALQADCTEKEVDMLLKQIDHLQHRAAQDAQYRNAKVKEEESTTAAFETIVVTDDDGFSDLANELSDVRSSALRALYRADPTGEVSVELFTKYAEEEIRVVNTLADDITSLRDTLAQIQANQTQLTTQLSTIIDKMSSPSHSTGLPVPSMRSSARPSPSARRSSTGPRLTGTPPVGSTSDIPPPSPSQ